jgi:hypothetical protein
LHCEKNNFENIFFVENSPVQPLTLVVLGVVVGGEANGGAAQLLVILKKAGLRNEFPH